MNANASLFGAFRSPKNPAFGSGMRQSLRKYVSGFGRRVFFVTDKRMAIDADFLALVALVEAGGASVSVLTVIAELPLECSAAGVEQDRSADVDFIVGIGGGS